MRTSRLLTARLLLAGLSLLLAFVLLASASLHDRMDSTVLVLLGAAALIVLVPWDKLASLKAVGVEITLNLPHVQEAVDSLDRISQATGGDPIDNANVRRALERLGPELELLQGSRILWIDDNPLQIVGVRRLLRALGSQIELVASTRSAEAVLEQDNDFDLLISDLMRNSPDECVTFDWLCNEVGASLSAEDDVIRRDDGTPVAFEVRETPEHTLVHERREGVNFVVRLRTEAGQDPLVRNLPVLFYASFPWTEAAGYARPAQLAGFDTDVTNSAETLIPTAIKMVAASRSAPIAVGGAKVLVKGNGHRVEAETHLRDGHQTAAPSA